MVDNCKLESCQGLQILTSTRCHTLFVQLFIMFLINVNVDPGSHLESYLRTDCDPTPRKYGVRTGGSLLSSTRFK